MLATTLLNSPAPLLAWGLYAFAATFFAGPPLIGEVVDHGSHRAATSGNAMTSFFTLDAATVNFSTTTSEVVELVTIVEISTRSAESETIAEPSTSTTVPETVIEALTTTPSFIHPIRTVTVTEIPQPVTIYADGTVATDTATPRDTPRDTPPGPTSEVLIYMLAGYAISLLSFFALRWLPLGLRYKVAVCFGILGTAELARASSPEIYQEEIEKPEVIQDQNDDTVTQPASIDNGPETPEGSIASSDDDLYRDPTPPRTPNAPPLEPQNQSPIKASGASEEQIHIPDHSRRSPADDDFDIDNPNYTPHKTSNEALSELDAELLALAVDDEPGRTEIQPPSDASESADDSSSSEDDKSAQPPANALPDSPPRRPTTRRGNLIPEYDLSDSASRSDSNSDDDDEPPPPPPAGREIAVPRSRRTGLNVNSTVPLPPSDAPSEPQTSALPPPPPPAGVTDPSVPALDAAVEPRKFAIPRHRRAGLNPTAPLSDAPSQPPILDLPYPLPAGTTDASAASPGDASRHSTGNFELPAFALAQPTPRPTSLNLNLGPSTTSGSSTFPPPSSLPPPASTDTHIKATSTPPREIGFVHSEPTVESTSFAAHSFTSPALAPRSAIAPAPTTSNPTAAPTAARRRAARNTNNLFVSKARKQLSSGGPQRNSQDQAADSVARNLTADQIAEAANRQSLGGQKSLPGFDLAKKEEDKKDEDVMKE
jgi:hypothetical protein